MIVLVYNFQTFGACHWLFSHDVYPLKVERLANYRLEMPPSMVFERIIFARWTQLRSHDHARVEWASTVITQRES